MSRAASGSTPAPAPAGPPSGLAAALERPKSCSTAGYRRPFFFRRPGLVPACLIAGLIGAMSCRTESAPLGTRQVAPGWSRLEPPKTGEMAWYRMEGQRPGDSAPRDFGLFGFGVFAGPVPDSTLLLVQEIRDRGLWDSLVVSRPGLAPLRERMATGSTVVHLEYDGPRVRRSEWRGDSVVRTDSAAFDTPVFAFNQLDVLLRSLPLDVTDRMILPLYSEGTGALEYDTVTVSRTRGRGGRRTWELRFADPAIVLTATSSGSGADLEDYEVVQRGDSGIRVRRRRASPPR